MKSFAIKPARVLVVDDEKDFIEPIVFWLESKGYEVATASNGKQALQSIRDDKPDIVFLDIQMPEMDGLETLKRIRSAHKKLPVVIITAAHQDTRHFAEAKKLGIAGFFPKQSELNKLIQIIETTLRTHSNLGGVSVKAITATAVLSLALAASALAAEPLRAQAVLRDKEGNRVGTAALEEVSGGVRIRLEVSQLPPGKHAMHIHASAQCDAPDFKSAGPHFNPAGKRHGRENPEGPHAGDLPDLEVKEDGTGVIETVAAGVTLSGEGENSLFHPGGTSLMVHASPDDNKTDPAGNAGDRIACGSILRLPLENT